MATIKSQGAKKFSKSRTDIDVPSISRPENLQMGMSLTGSADIDNNNPENLYFHIFSSMLPQRITLYVYGERFNQNFYTEIGQHNHGPGTLATGNVTSGSTTHTHSVAGNAPNHQHTVTPNIHRHALYVGNDDGGYKIDVDGDSINNGYNYTMPVDGGASIMTFESGGAVLSTSNGSFAFSTYLSIINTNVNTHGHTVSSGSTTSVGLAPGVGSLHTSGTPKQYFSAMKIAIDGVDKTALLLTQTAFVAFGDGTAGHGIVSTGAELDLTPFISTPGQHKITFSLNTGSPDNGGKVRYNLYTIA